jgi:hypothetical protein
LLDDRKETCSAGSSFPLGATVGIILGGAALVALSVFFVLVFARRKRDEDDSSSSAKGKALLGSATSSGPVAILKTGRKISNSKFKTGLQCD